MGEKRSGEAREGERRGEEERQGKGKRRGKGDGRREDKTDKMRKILSFSLSSLSRPSDGLACTPCFAGLLPSD